MHSVTAPLEVLVGRGATCVAPPTNVAPACPPGSAAPGTPPAAAQRDCAQFWADHIVDVFCVIDGVPVANLGAYRFLSPQFQFTAPTPWIFGDTGGVGMSVGDGYYLMLAPMSKGTHTIHYGGTFHFEAGEIGNEQPLDLPKDIMIILNVR